MEPTVRIKILPDGRVSRNDAAAFLGLSPKTLAQMACSGRGPRARKVGGRAFYFIRDLEAFVATGARQAA
jgi:hypothetical protein